MFETSLVESSGALKSKSGRYMGVTVAFNAAIVALMILVPLLYPEALPRTVMAAMLSAPLPPATAPPPPPTVARTVKATAPLDPFTAPPKTPNSVAMIHDDPPPTPGTGVASMDNGVANSLSTMSALGLGPTPTPIKAPPIKPLAPPKISSGVIAGNKLSGSTPAYPAIAKAARVQGSVVLHAIISKTGAIESLSVVSGPEMLRSSAVSAVQDWKYRPYLLSGEPTEVDTTITVNFSFGS